MTTFEVTVYGRPEKMHVHYLQHIDTPDLVKIHTAMSLKALRKYCLGQDPTKDELIYLQIIHHEMINRFYLMRM